MRIPDDLVLKSVSLKDQYFDLKGLAKYSGLSLSTLRHHIKVSNLPCYRLGGKILIQKSEFDAWLKRYRLNRSRDLNTLADEIVEEIGKHKTAKKIRSRRKTG